MGLTAGILLVLISLAHNVYGEIKQMPALRSVTDDSTILGSHRIMVFQGGTVLLVIGLIQISVSIGLIELTGIAAYFLVLIVLINFFTALFIALIFHRTIFSSTIPQFVIFAIIIILQLIAL